MDALGLLVSLIIDTSASWLRMFAALFISVVVSVFVGIWAARSRGAERIIIPILDIFQTLPILAFFPFVIFVVVATLPGVIGINAAVIFLIVTSMVWNITFGVYESIKAMPKEFLEVASLYHMGLLDRLRRIFIPAAMPRVVEQSVLSWSIGLFYLVTSEIFSTGNANYAVKYGIGVAITKLALSGNTGAYALALAVFIAFVIATRFLFFMPLERRYSRYMKSASKQGGAIAKMIIFAKRRIFPAQRKPGTGAPKPEKPRLQKGAAAHPVSKVPKEERLGRNYRALYYAVALAALTAILAYLYLYYPELLGYEVLALVSLLVSFARVWGVFAVILAIALPLCAYLVFISKHQNTYLLVFQVVASIPATILLPVLVVALEGYPLHSELVAVVVYFLSGIWYVIFSIIASTRTLSPSVLEVKKLFGIKGTTAFRKIYLMAMLPGVITGAVTGIAAEWNASIVAEYFTSTAIGNGAVITAVHTGIGRLLDVSLGTGNLTLMLIALLNLTAMIILINKFVWKRFYKKIEKVYE